MTQNTVKFVFYVDIVSIHYFFSFLGTSSVGTILYTKCNRLLSPSSYICGYFRYMIYLLYTANLFNGIPYGPHIILKHKSVDLFNNKI